MPLCFSMLRSALRLSLLPAVLVAPVVAHADSLAFTGGYNNNFSYDVLASTGSISFGGGSTISLVGFTGVNSVTLSSLAASLGTVSYSNSAIVYTLNANQSYSAPAPVDFALYTVNTTSNTVGPLFYTLNETTGAHTGTIAATTNAITPEPSSLILLGSGCVGVASVLRRRLR